MNKFVMSAALFLAFTASAMATEKKNDNLDLICDKADVMEKALADKGYFTLLNMKNKEKVAETIWVGGQSAVITALEPESNKICVLALLDNVVFNSDTIQGLYKSWDQQETKKKGI